MYPPQGHAHVFDFGLSFKGTVSGVVGAPNFQCSDLVGYGNDYFVGYWAYVVWDAAGGGAAPQGELLIITDYVSTTGDFTVAAFSAAIGVGDKVLILHPAIAAILGGASEVKFLQSDSGAVEENAQEGFDITIFDIDSGAVPAADIDITGISAIMEQSRGGAAFSSAGITQPTFAKAAGRVYASYQFLAAEWQIGDMYRLRVTGITCVVDTVTLYVPAMVWSNWVVEGEDIKTEIDKMVGATGNFFEQADVPVNVTAIVAGVNILDLSTADTRYILRDLTVKCADPGVDTVTIRLYRLVNDVQVLTDSFEINHVNYGSYFNLMDMFSVPYVAGDDILITAVASANSYAVTGQYSYAKTNV